MGSPVPPYQITAHDVLEAIKSGAREGTAQALKELFENGDAQVTLAAAADIADRGDRELGEVSVTDPVDISDRDDRKLGQVTFPEAQEVTLSGHNLPPTDALPVQVAGHKAEISSEQITLGENPQAIQRATGASKIEIYVESGEVRVRTDGQDASLTTGQPLGAGFMDVFAVDELSVFRVTDEAIITVVHRQ